MWILLIGLHLLGTSVQASIPPSDQQVRLEDDFWKMPLVLSEQLESFDRLMIDSRIKSQLKDRTVIFVAGIMNGVVGAFAGYFDPNVEVLKDEYGAHVREIGPNSWNSVQSNVPILYEKWMRIYNKSHRKLIVICHSKGCAESLLTVLKYPSLIEEGIVDRLVLVQGAVGGSPLANSLTLPKDGSFLRKLGIGEVLNPLTWGEIAFREILTWLWPGVYSMRQGVLEGEYERALAQWDAHLKKILNEKTLVVIGTQRPGQFSFFMKLFNFFKTDDGLLRMVNQDTVVLQDAPHVRVSADHMDLFIPIANAPVGFQKNFTRALFRLIVNPEIAFGNSDLGEFDHRE